MLEPLFGLLQRDLTDAAAKLDATSSGGSGTVEQELLAFASNALKSLAIGPDYTEKLAPLFEGRYSSNFTTLVRKSFTADLDRSELFWLAFYISALFREFSLRKTTFSEGEAQVLAFFADRKEKFTSEENVRIEYLHSKLPVDLLLATASQLASSTEDRFSEERKRLQALFDRVASFETALKNWEDRTSQLQALIRKQAEDLNFIGLSKAFTSQISIKTRELWFQIIFLACTGLMLVVFPFLPNILGMADWSTSPIKWSKILPFAVSELVLLYFFRVFLRNYLSIKTQLLQLELRASVCAFIQSYAEFVGPLRTASGAATLEKFEALVFSGISPDPQKVPSQFDGLESISKLMADIRSASK